MLEGKSVFTVAAVLGNRDKTVHFYQFKGSAFKL